MSDARLVAVGHTAEEDVFSLDEKPGGAAASIDEKVVRVGTEIRDCKLGDEIIAGPALRVADAVGQLRRHRQLTCTHLALIWFADVVADPVVLELNRLQLSADFDGRRCSAGPEYEVRRTRAARCREAAFACSSLVRLPGRASQLLGRDVQRDGG